MRKGWIYKTFRDYLDKVGVYMVVVVTGCIITSAQPHI